MDDEIQFGEVEEASPQTNLRPDQNKHFAVVEYGSPDDRDLPIFVDLDVLADMEDHALSDMSVELGGVLLGGCYTDDAGRPFIVVTDSLRAQHYESTKGSFTFTHDTWSAITREREEFPSELSMVGWYHTHPDWGVFLSGMDMFICDNFFNKPLDLAYVIDPCRGDRGMFQWTGNRASPDKSQRVRRTGGFFVTASRFRAAELEHYVGELSGAMPATSMRATAGSHGGAPVVHLHQPPQPQPPAWQAPAVVGMLCLQFCLLALIAWRMVDPRLGSGAPASSEAELSDLKAAVTARAAAETALEKARLRTEVLDTTAQELRGTPTGFIERLTDKYEQTERLAADIAARDSQIDVLKRQLEEETSTLRVARLKAEGEVSRLKNVVEDLNKKLAVVQKDNETLIAKNEPAKPLDPATGGDEKAAAASSRLLWWYVGGGILAAVVLVAGVWWGGKLLTDKNEIADGEPLASDNKEQSSPRHGSPDDASSPAPNS